MCGDGRINGCGQASSDCAVSGNISLGLATVAGMRSSDRRFDIARASADGDEGVVAVDSARVPGRASDSLFVQAVGSNDSYITRYDDFSTAAFRQAGGAMVVQQGAGAAEAGMSGFAVFGGGSEDATLLAMFGLNSGADGSVGDLLVSSASATGYRSYLQSESRVAITSSGTQADWRIAPVDGDLVSAAGVELALVFDAGGTGAEVRVFASSTGSWSTSAALRRLALNVGQTVTDLRRISDADGDGRDELFVLYEEAAGAGAGYLVYSACADADISLAGAVASCAVGVDSSTIGSDLGGRIFGIDDSGATGRSAIGVPEANGTNVHIVRSSASPGTLQSMGRISVSAAGDGVRIAELVSVGDVDGDGARDTLVTATYNSVAEPGDAAAWLLLGPLTEGTVDLPADADAVFYTDGYFVRPTWTAAGGDFDGDGFSDIVLANTDGDPLAGSTRGVSLVFGGSE